MGYSEEGSSFPYPVIPPITPAETWVNYRDYDPDKQRSHSGLVAEDCGEDVRVLLPVRGCGVLVLRAMQDESGEWVFMGLSTFTDREIGWLR